MEKIQNVTRVLLLVWFMVISLFILVPSFFVLRRAAEADRVGAQTLPPPAPQPPEPAAFDKSLDKDVQQKQIQSRVDVYQHQVTAYSHQMGAYKSQLEAQAKSPLLAVYQTVVKDTLVSLITGLLTALIGYVFVKAGAEVAKEYIQAKSKAAGGT